jgi:hypothetical protein
MCIHRFMEIPAHLFSVHGGEPQSIPPAASSCPGLRTGTFRRSSNLGSDQKSRNPLSMMKVHPFRLPFRSSVRTPLK